MEQGNIEEKGIDFGDSEKVKQSEDRIPEIVYDPEKDFYRGISGELRLKAEGLFKKAKEKGISIEEIDITILRENQVDFPGIGLVDLPAYVVKVKGRDIQSQRVIADGKHIDYFNRYQKYAAEKIERKNLARDERGRIVRENNKPLVKQDVELTLTDWERFEIGRDLVSDKEFGLEKTITGACDRVIRKLMGENDWLDPEEARLLDEEYNSVQKAIAKEQETRKQVFPGLQKKATERQINYFKARIKNSGLDPENESIVREILRQAGFGVIDINDLSIANMSRLIDSMSEILPKVKDVLGKRGHNGAH